MKSTTPIKEKGRTLFKESLRVYDAKSESWKDGTLSAKSDGTVKYRNNGAIVSIGMVKQPTAPTAKLLTQIILFKLSNINYR
jgi:predicted RecA/RadA family phage recombinase